MYVRHRFKDLKTGEIFTAELKIDDQSIAHQLAGRARLSKVGKARSMHGAIVCRIVSTEPSVEEGVSDATAP